MGGVSYDKKIIFLLSAISVMDIAILFAQGTADVGTLTLSNKNWPLKHALAYEMPGDDEGKIVVVLSGQAVTNEQLKKAMDPEGEGDYSSFKKPFLQLISTRRAN
jgi:hypothetical protein